MSTPTPTRKPGRPPQSGLFRLLKPYRALISILIAITILGNSLNLLVPRIIAHAIDNYTQQRLILTTLVVEFFAAAFGLKKSCCLRHLSVPASHRSVWMSARFPRFS